LASTIHFKKSKLHELELYNLPGNTQNGPPPKLGCALLGGEDYFFHVSGLNDEDAVPKEGDRLSFDVIESEKGPKAIRIGPEDEGDEDVGGE